MQLPPVAHDQAGLFSRFQALEGTTSSGALDRAARAGSLVRLASGMHVARDQLDHLDRRGEHLLRARAEILSLGGDWHTARRTAAVLHGLPLLGHAPAEVQLTRSRSTSKVRSDSRHRHINVLTEAECEVVDGLPTTSLARTVYDLARRESFRSAVVVADAALRTGLPRSELMALLELHPRWPGARAARGAFLFADGRAESPLESLGRTTCLEQSLPVFEPQVQVWVDGELVARVDGLWREQLVVFEGDGALKFLGDEEGAALPALLIRQERLREAGLPGVRAFWEDVTSRRAAWARGVRRELADNPGRLRAGVELRSTSVRPTPLDRFDHYTWPRASPVLATHRRGADGGGSGRRVA